jgi:hypothetical protein
MSRLWFSRRALGLHAVIVVVVPTFIALCVWQVHRALGGNELSWAYVFEWPFFAGYAVYMWWRFVHDVPDAPAPAASDATVGKATPVTATEPAPASVTPAAAAEDDEMAAYNRYLAELAEQDTPKRW